jgi:hypothetical protein
MARSGGGGVLEGRGRLFTRQLSGSRSCGNPRRTLFALAAPEATAALDRVHGPFLRRCVKRGMRMSPI